MINKKTLRKDKRAVSPVIGVILMVAITVILAAVIAAFVFGVGTPPVQPDLYFTNVQVNAGAPTTIMATLVGSDVIDVTAGTSELRIKNNAGGGTWEDTDLETGDFIPAAATNVTGGNMLDFDTATAAGTGDVVRIVISHTPTGAILLDIKVIAA